MAKTPEYSKMTKAELTALAKRKKISVKAGALKEDMVKAIKRGLRKIEAQKKSKSPARAKTSKKKTSSKTTKAKTKSKTGSAKKTTRKPARKSSSGKKTPVVSKKHKHAGGAAKKKHKKTATLKPKVVKPKKTIRPVPRKPEKKTDFPDKYDDNRLVILPRDPNWAFVYWDLNPGRVRELTSGKSQNRWVLRVYSAPLHPSMEKGFLFDVDIDFGADNYYLDISRPGGRFLVEVGVMDNAGMFRAAAQSNPVIMPIDHPSEEETTQGSSPYKNPVFYYGGSAPPGSSHAAPIPEALGSSRGTHLFKTNRSGSH